MEIAAFLENRAMWAGTWYLYPAVSCVLSIILVSTGHFLTHMSFHFQARYALLTYAQCDDLDGFRVMDLISGLGGECIVARESHADLGLHLHCFVDFGRKFRSRRTDIFDVEGRHPNIQSSRGTPWAGYDYAIKDGDVICGGLGRPEEPSSKRVKKDWDQWTEITNARDRDHFWELVHHLDPKAAACSYGQLAKYAEFRFAVKPPVYASPSGVSFVGGDVDGRDAWVDQSGIRSGEPLLGESCPSLRIALGGDPLRPLPRLCSSRTRIR